MPFTIQNGVILYLLCYPPLPKIPNQELSVVLPSSPLKIGGISVKGLLSFSRTYKQTEITTLYIYSCPLTLSYIVSLNLFKFGREQNFQICVILSIQTLLSKFTCFNLQFVLNLDGRNKSKGTIIIFKM